MLLDEDEWLPDDERCCPVLDVLMICVVAMIAVVVREEGGGLCASSEVKSVCPFFRWLAAGRIELRFGGRSRPSGAGWKRVTWYGCRCMKDDDVGRKMERGKEKARSSAKWPRLGWLALL